MDRKKIIDFVKAIGKDFKIGIVLLFCAIVVLCLLIYFAPTGTLDQSIVLIASITAWLTICFRLWIDFKRGRPKKEKIFSLIIYFFIFAPLGIYTLLIIFPQPELTIHLTKAFISFYSGAIIVILYEVVKQRNKE